MALRKSVAFREDTEISMFFFNQPPNLVLETYNEKLNDNDNQILEKCDENPVVAPSYCQFYELESSESDEETEYVPERIKYINMSEIYTVESHFLLFIDRPGEFISYIIDILIQYFSNDELETLTIVKPLKKKDADNEFKIGYEGVIVGVSLKNTENSQQYIATENQMFVKGLGSIKLIPGTRGEHIWNKYIINKNFLQGFFFVGPDIVDTKPNNLCYLASYPRSFTKDFIIKEIFSHINEKPVHIITNSLEEKCIARLEFDKPETVKFLMRRCMSFDGKAVLVLPCIDRTPVEAIYQKYQVCVSGYSNAINPKEFIRLLHNSFGPVVELNVNYEGLETLVVFQTLKAAELCLSKKEIFVRNHKIKFNLPHRPYRLTGLKVHKGKYNTKTPDRPLPIVPAPYTFEPQPDGNFDKL
jgi:hypothetical protein